MDLLDIIVNLNLGLFFILVLLYFLVKFKSKQGLLSIILLMLVGISLFLLSLLVYIQGVTTSGYRGQDQFWNVTKALIPVFVIPISLSLYIFYLGVIKFKGYNQNN